MDEQAKGPSDQELADAGDQRAQLRIVVASWIESKGISRCRLCGQEDAWDLASVESVYPLAFRTVEKIVNSEPNRQPGRPPKAPQEWVLGRIRDAIRNNMRISGLTKLTCGNCRYALLLDRVKMREDSEDQ